LFSTDALNVLSDIIFDVAGGLGGIALRASSKAASKAAASINKVKQIDRWSRTPKSIQDRLALEAAKKGMCLALQASLKYCCLCLDCKHCKQ
jgi:hypothetical protein